MRAVEILLCLRLMTNSLDMSRSFRRMTQILVVRAGLEPATARLSVECSTN